MVVSPRLLIATGALLLAPLGCSTDDLGRKIAQLDEGERREQVIDELLAAVRRAPAKRRERIRERVVFALMEAYRQDVRRGQIVSALALLRDPRAEEVFVAAVKDAKRAGAYFEAALRAARMLGELRLQAAVPHLIAALKEAQQDKPSEQSTLLKRALIEALRQLGDLRAVPTLVSVLRAEPMKQDMALTGRAAEALGDLRAVAAVPALVDLLGGSHGMLLFETSRRALCRVGQPASESLEAIIAKQDKGGRRAVGAVGAVTVLADLGEPDASIDPRPKDAPVYMLAAAEARLRWQQSETAESWLLSVLGDRNSVADRCRAARLLGWYGAERARDELARLIVSDELPRPLLWAAVLAHARLAGGPEAPKLVLPPGRPDGSKRDERLVAPYQERLAAINRCRERKELSAEVACLLEAVGDAAWRTSERAALEVGRLAVRRELSPTRAKRIALTLARALAGGKGRSPAHKPEAAVKESLHPQVARALLISLERVEKALTGQVVLQVAAIVDQGLQSPQRIRGGNRSRSRCMVERLRRQSAGPKLNKESR